MITFSDLTSKNVVFECRAIMSEINEIYLWAMQHQHILQSLKLQRKLLKR